MKIRTMIAATCAALAFSMAGPIYAHDSEAETVTSQPLSLASRRKYRAQFIMFSFASSGNSLPRDRRFDLVTMTKGIMFGVFTQPGPFSVVGKYRKVVVASP